MRRAPRRRDPRNLERRDLDHPPGPQDRAIAPGPTTRPRETLTPESTIALQRRAGNAAIVTLLDLAAGYRYASVSNSDNLQDGTRPPAPDLDRPDERQSTVQRDTLDAADDPRGYTQPGGAKVAGSGMTRIQVTGLSYGVKGGHQPTYVNWRGVKVPSSEKTMTKESPNNTAVVIAPDTLDPSRPTQVVLHFHGWGFRNIDPYAGYAVATGQRAGQGAKGTVRDVDQEHWAQQMGAVSKERAPGGMGPASVAGPQIIAVLAQGRGMSDFGNVPTFDYVKDVFDKAGGTLAKITTYHVILSAHSGGGDKQVATKVNAGDAVGTDRSRLAPPTAGHAPQQASDLVILFDAEGSSSTMSWIEGEIRRLSAALKAAADPAAAQAAVLAAPKFRGYFATKGSYWAAFHDASRRLESALAAVPAAWRNVDASNPLSVKVRDLFRFIEVTGAGVDHEHVISGGVGGPPEAGALADALRASLDPTIDRSKAYDPTEGGKRLAKWQADVRAWKAKKSAAKAAKDKAAADKPPRASAPPVQPTVQRDDTTPTPPKAAPKSTWKASGAATDFALTEADKTLLAGKTADQRSADQALLTRAALKRLTVLIAAEKAKKLKPGEDTELADLRALKDRVETTNRALKRQDVEQIMDASGQGTVATWFGDIKKGTFLGIALRAHKALAARLTQAESALVADAKINPGKKSATDLGADLQMYASTSDLREPAKAVGGSSLSMHTFGLAVDLNYKGNPFIGNAGAAAPDAIRRATSLVLGTATEVGTSLGDAQASFTALKGASDALKTYFSFRDAANLPALTAAVTGHTAAKGEPADLAGWQAQIAADYEALNGKGDFKKHKPPEEGFLDLHESVVLALTGAGLTWGGTYPTDKDLMHFDLREAEGAKIDAARRAHVANL
ncbi:MAG TPA: hypothetical protein VIT41_09285 [Microlunatus sp.]